MREHEALAWTVRPVLYGREPQEIWARKFGIPRPPKMKDVVAHLRWDALVFILMNQIFWCSRLQFAWLVSRPETERVWRSGIEGLPSNEYPQNFGKGPLSRFSRQPYSDYDGCFQPLLNESKPTSSLSENFSFRRIQTPFSLETQIQTPYMMTCVRSTERAREQKFG